MVHELATQLKFANEQNTKLTEENLDLHHALQISPSEKCKASANGPASPNAAIVVNADTSTNPTGEPKAARGINELLCLPPAKKNQNLQREASALKFMS